MTVWKLQSYLESHGLSAYELVQASKLAPNTVYGAARGKTKAVRLETLEAMVKALRELTGQHVSVADLLEVEEASPRIEKRGNITFTMPEKKRDDIGLSPPIPHRGNLTGADIISEEREDRF